ncbi:MAG: dienelactone hydrolase [Chthoniobacteraceae bacterium]|nr:dienelactone hydrolase [Chthoniobacteraceae bacterium]MDB6173910.1 dienelactone hydrolase [Chthoniobacteraceae bacterium]
MNPKLVFSSLVLLPQLLFAEIKTQVVEYKDGATVLEGLVSFDDAIKEKRPAVLVVHDWMGVTDHTRTISEDLAKLGYIAFAADIYGKGVRPADAKAAGAEAGKFKADRALLRKRANLGLEELKKQQFADSGKIAAIGFCFGGTTVLELARSGAPIAGVVTFHGGLDSPTPADGKNIKAKVLVLHGADDPFVKPADITAFQDELRNANVDWQMNYYGDAVHAFTQKKAGTDKSKGAAYNEPAARRSWQAMKDFFAEIFAK